MQGNGNLQIHFMDVGQGDGGFGLAQPDRGFFRALVTEKFPFSISHAIMILD